MRALKPLILVHGGAGRWNQKGLKKASSVLLEAAKVGFKVLDEGGSSLDAVVEAVTLMEKSGIFNAGKGACKDLSGGIGLDASVMWRGRAGAVTCVSATWNAVRLARMVMEKTKHVLIAGTGADELAVKYGLPLMEQLRINEAKARDTVGAVALDINGDLATATSTGGIRGKLKGRVGDTPIPGAGFWESKRIALSSTGLGEEIIMAQPCRLAAWLYEVQGVSLKDALWRACSSVKGPCGIIAVTADGGAAASTTAEFMPIALFKENRGLSLVIKNGESIEI